jgi:hypothetical protein
MASEIPDQIKEWTRELLGGRGFIKAWNNPRERRKILQIVERVEELRIAPEDVHDYFHQAKDGRNGLDEIIDRIGKPQGKVSARPKVTAPAPTGSSPARTSGSASSGGPGRPAASSSGDIGRDESAREEIGRLRLDLEWTRKHARDLEELVRAITERAVLDATRIKGLEAAIMTVAHAAGMTETVEQAYFTATARYLDPRTAQLTRARANQSGSVAR